MRSDAAEVYLATVAECWRVVPEGTRRRHLPSPLLENGLDLRRRRTRAPRRREAPAPAPPPALSRLEQAVLDAGPPGRVAYERLLSALGLDSSDTGLRWRNRASGSEGRMLSWAVWQALARALFGRELRAWRWRCPSCDRESAYFEWVDSGRPLAQVAHTCLACGHVAGQVLTPALLHVQRWDGGWCWVFPFAVPQEAA